MVEFQRNGKQKLTSLTENSHLKLYKLKKFIKMRMTNQSWEAAACGAIERKLFSIMMTNDWDNQRFVDEEAKEIWTSMYRNFCEGYPSFPEEKKQWLIEKLLKELPTFSDEKKKWLLEKLKP